MQLNIKSDKHITYDAIVIGTGISGGWAAKELTEQGLKTLVLDRGRPITHVEDYETMNKEPWELPYYGQVPRDEMLRDYPEQMKTGFTIDQAQKHWWPKDPEHPYSYPKENEFLWVRSVGHQGGRSLLWGRQCYRFSDLDFSANLKEGIAVDWPIRYKDLAPWYDKVERFIGVSGQKEGLSQLPDGDFLPPMEMNCVEKHLKNILKTQFDRCMTIGRAAHLTQPHNGRGQCMSRDRCMRGCPFGAYFSSNASTLPAAEKTDNMFFRPYSLVTEILYDKRSRRASGVRVFDTQTRAYFDYKAKIIFCCASTFASTSLLLQSQSDRFPNGMGNDSDQLGRNIMDHHFKVGATGDYPGFKDKDHIGRRPNGIYIPRFQNLRHTESKQANFLRGYGYQGGASRASWQSMVSEMGYGTGFKEQLLKQGSWEMGLIGFGEVLPHPKNRMTINTDKKDIYGMPTLHIDCKLRTNEKNMRQHMMQDAVEMLEAAGFNNTKPYDDNYRFGEGIHEMGTARMGHDPDTSVLNKWNQIHAVPNVFVTDGSCMTSSSCVNPSLTYMALTARAVNYAVAELKKGNL